MLYTGEAQVSELTRAIGPMVADVIVAKTDGPELLPAALDAYRYFYPDSTWAMWLSRIAKASMFGVSFVF